MTPMNHPCFVFLYAVSLSSDMVESMSNSLIIELIWEKRRNEETAKFGSTCNNDTQENCQQIKLIMMNKKRICGKGR